MLNKIMFVCHGNICRSPMAEYVLKNMIKEAGRKDEFIIASCATSTEEIGNDIHRGTKRKLTAEGVPFEYREAVQLQKDDYDKWDLFIGMDGANVKNMLRIFGSDSEHKVKRLLDFAEGGGDIADPWYTGDFDKTYDDIAKGCEALLRKI